MNAKSNDKKFGNERSAALPPFAGYVSMHATADGRYGRGKKLRVLWTGKSEYNEISVVETGQLFGETGRFRCLKFADDAVQGAIDLRRPERVALAYQRAVVGLMERSGASFRRAFVIGHGTGAIAKRFSDRDVVTAELDPMVVELSRTYFGYDRNNVKIGDGRELLSREEDGAFDFVVVDAFTSEGTPRPMTTPSFFEMAAGKLRDDGALIFNLFGKTRGDRRAGAAYAALRETFPFAAAFGDAGRPGAEGNLLLVGSRREIPLREQAVAGFAPVDLEPGFPLRD